MKYKNKEIYTFSLVSDANVLKSCFFYVESKFLIPYQQFLSFLSLRRKALSKFLSGEG